jgi:hypothetical protein
VKALQHFHTAVKPPITAEYFDLYLTLAVAVIDGPMMGARVQEISNKLIYLPWVRTVRHEYFEGADWLERGRAFAVDIVHKDFLPTYIENHVQIFAAEFSGLAIKHDKVLASGKAFVSGMSKNPYVELEKRLKPRYVSPSVRPPHLRSNLLSFRIGLRTFLGSQPGRTFVDVSCNALGELLEPVFLRAL